MVSELWSLPAVELAARFARREATPLEALAAVHARMDRVNPRLNAVIARDDAAARAMADASTARWAAGAPLSRLDGVPFTVKDNIPAAGLPTSWGSAAFRPLAPDGDELPVARLRAAGAVLLGKTNVPEFTLQGYTDNAVFGPTRNPWNPSLTPGGSSGGAVAAVAAGIGPFAIGTDGGGSIRRPASHVGLVGLKPGLGRVARRDGLPAILLDYETICPVARNVADVMAVMEVIGRPDDGDPASLGQAPFAPLPAPACRILYVPQFGDHPVDPEIAASADAVAVALAGLGHRVEAGKAPFDVEAVARIQATVSQAGLAWLVAKYGIAPAAPSLREMAAAGAALPASALFAALDAASTLRRALAAEFTSYDLILTPAAAALPWPAAETHPAMIAGRPVGPRGHAVFTAFANIAGLPGIAVPGPHSAAGLPIGVQIVGPRGAEALLLAIAGDLEARHGWGQAWPALGD